MEALNVKLAGTNFSFLLSLIFVDYLSENVSNKGEGGVKTNMIHIKEIL